MKFKHKLNPILWNKDNQLKPLIREKLLNIAEFFIEQLDLDEDLIDDIVLLGSNCSYNYTEHSDIDLHFELDMDKADYPIEILQKYCDQFRMNFNTKHDITIKGLPVEFYIEDINHPNASNGIYSLIDDCWVKFPKRMKDTNNDRIVNKKYDLIKGLVDRLDDSNNDIADTLIQKISRMRKYGLRNGIETTPENLTFKQLRNNGVLDRLHSIRDKGIDRNFSLEHEIQPSDMDAILEHTRDFHNIGHELRTDDNPEFGKNENITNDKVIDAIRKLYSLFRKNKTIKVYRYLNKNMSPDKFLESQTKRNVGICWTWNIHKGGIYSTDSNPHNWKKKAKFPVYILEAKISRDDVNWKDTVKLFVVNNNLENELRLFKNKDIVITGLYEMKNEDDESIEKIRKIRLNVVS